MAVCVPGTTESCYSGPPGTLGLGLCVAGTRACLADGSGFSPCMGETLPAVELAATPEDEDCSGGNECGNKVAWSFRFGSDLPAPPWPGPGPAPFPDNDKILAATVTSAGDTLLTARIHGLFEYAPGKTVGGGGLLMRLDPQGVVKTAFDISLQWERSLFAAPDGGFFLFGQEATTGGFDPIPYTLSRYDAADGLVYQKTFMAPGLRMESVAFLPNGHILVLGSFRGDFMVDGLSLKGPIEMESLYLAELDASATWLWVKTFPQIDRASGHSLLLDASGDVYAGGNFGGYKVSGHIDLGGGILKAPAGKDDFYARLTATGGHVWSKQVSALGTDAGASLAAITPEGSLLLAGSTYWPPMSLGESVYYDVTGGNLGDTRFFARVSANGETISTVSTKSIQFGGLSPRAGGKVHFVSGFASKTPVDVLGKQAASHAGSPDFMVGTIGGDNTLEHACIYGSASGESARAAGVCPDGAYVVVGSFDEMLDLGVGAPIQASWGLFVAKIQP